VDNRRVLAKAGDEVPYREKILDTFEVPRLSPAQGFDKMGIAEKNWEKKHLEFFHMFPTIAPVRLEEGDSKIDQNKVVVIPEREVVGNGTK
jgi:hypothetical protein